MYVRWWTRLRQGRMRHLAVVARRSGCCISCGRNILWISRAMLAHPASASLTGRVSGAHGFDIKESQGLPFAL